MDGPCPRVIPTYWLRCFILSLPSLANLSLGVGYRSILLCLVVMLVVRTLFIPLSQLLLQLLLALGETPNYSGESCTCLSRVLDGFLVS